MSERAKNQQYFTSHPSAESAPRQVKWRLPDMMVVLWTDRGVFSAGKVDRGTDLLARALELPAEGEILDLGAGYGPLGIVAARRYPQARVTLVEVNERAAALAQRNLSLNGVNKAQVLIGDAPEVLGERQFDAVLFNPPMHAGKAVVMRLIADAYGRLRSGGSLWFVAQTKQGAKTLARDVGQIFAQVEQREIRGGFRVYRAQK
jgi:16S rRNA (guanine1207-N2)-methyltransferase